MSQQNDDDNDDLFEMEDLIENPEYVPQNAVYTKDELDSHIAAFAEQREQLANLNRDLDLLVCTCLSFGCDCTYDYEKDEKLNELLQHLFNRMRFNCPGHSFNKYHICVICLSYDTNYDKWTREIFYNRREMYKNRKILNDMN